MLEHLHRELLVDRMGSECEGHVTASIVHCAFEHAPINCETRAIWKTRIFVSCWNSSPYILKLSEFASAWAAEAIHGARFASHNTNINRSVASVMLKHVSI